jgi:cytochrome c-type biogenesis protein CcmE
MKRRLLYLLGIGILVAFAGFAMASFRQTLTPYVTFEQARSLERTLQVAGGLVDGSSTYDRAEEALLFTLEEPESGQHLRVLYRGLKPANFEEAISIVAIGRFDPAQDIFQADKLLVKCPSKYQGVESETKQYG